MYKKKITIHYKTLKANDIDQLSTKIMCIKKYKLEKKIKTKKKENKGNQIIFFAFFCFQKQKKYFLKTTWNLTKSHKQKERKNPIKHSNKEQVNQKFHKQNGNIFVSQPKPKFKSVFGTKKKKKKKKNF
jgi:hypothetical protein